MSSTIYLREAAGRVVVVERGGDVDVDRSGDVEGVPLIIEAFVMRHNLHVNEKFGQFNSSRTPIEGLLLLCHFQI